MRTRSLALLALLASIASPPHTIAAEQPPPPDFPRLDLSGSLRTRYEYLDNFTIRRCPADQADNLLLTRLRLEADLIMRTDFRLYTQLQDNRFFSQDFDVHDFPPSNPYENRLDLRQAFIEAKHLWEGPLGFKIGRQAISYADNRIWGPGDWGNTGRYVWDAAKLYYHTDLVALDAIAGERVLPNALEFDGNHYPYQGYGLYATLPQLKPLTLDLFYALKRDAHQTTKGESGTSDLNRHTVGLHAKSDLPYGFDGNATAAYQFGNQGKDDVRACAFAGELGYPVIESVIPRELLYLADEIFFTGTAAEVTPVRSVDRIPVGAGRRGPITEQIQKAFFAIVEGRAPDRHGWLTPVPQHSPIGA